MLALLMLLPTSLGATLAGVTMPDSVDLGGQSLVLNGMGLREKYFIDVYIGGLYLPSKTTSSSSAITQDVPKRLVMHFVYNEVGADKLRGAFDEGLANVPNGSSQRANFDKLNGMMETVGKGDKIYLDYVPGTGTTIWINNSEKGTIAGSGFMKALWGVYLGSAPPTAKLKRGLLGR